MAKLCGTWLLLVILAMASPALASTTLLVKASNAVPISFEAPGVCGSADAVLDIVLDSKVKIWSNERVVFFATWGRGQVIDSVTGDRIGNVRSRNQSVADEDIPMILISHFEVSCIGIGETDNYTCGMHVDRNGGISDVGNCQSEETGSASYDE